MSWGITWDDTKRRLLAGTLGALSALFLLGPPAGLSIPALARGSAAPLAIIVMSAPGGAAAARAAVVTAGGSVGRRLDLIDGFAATVPADVVEGLRASRGVRSVSANLPLQPRTVVEGYDAAADTYSMAADAALMGATHQWAAGITGRGVDVALIDTGISPVAGLSAAGKVVNGPDLSTDAAAPALRYLDAFGHGTHVAGIIAGHDAAGSGPDPYSGIAPGARLVNVKVGAANGAFDVTQVIAGIGWVVAHRNDNGLNIRVLNLSFGTDSTQAYTDDPLAYAAELAWRSGIVVVAAAGNSGTRLGALDNPATDPALIAVGAGDTPAGTVAAFSSWGSGTRNPDLIAPGVHVQGLRVPGSAIDQGFPSARLGSRYFRGSGTSQAAAMVSGAVALLVQQHPAWTPDQVKYALTSTASPLAGFDARAQGAGVVRLGAAGAISALLAPIQALLFAAAGGQGSIERARGSVHITRNNVDLTGEQDVEGQSTGTAGIIAQGGSAGSSGSTWSGSTWSGSTWSGSTWSGSTWSGSTWSGSTWSGSTWSGSTWSGGIWAAGLWA